MKKYSMIHIPVMSFFARDFYRDVCLHWKGTNFLYLFILLLICWIPAIVKVHIGFSDFRENEAPAVVSQIPQITIENGEASVDVNQPYHIMDPDTKRSLVIIDTTGSITSLDDAEAAVLIAKNQAIFKRNAYETRQFSFAEIPQFTLDQQTINGWLDNIQKYLALTLFPCALLGSFVFRIIQVLIYAAIGLFFASLCHTNRSYLSLIRLAVLAVSPCIIIKTILGIAGIDLPFAGLLFLVIAMGYLYFGVKASTDDDDDDDNHEVDNLRLDGGNPNPYSNV